MIMSASLHSDREERDNLELALVISMSTPGSLQMYRETEFLLAACLGNTLTVCTTVLIPPSGDVFLTPLWPF